MLVCFIHFWEHVLVMNFYQLFLLNLDSGCWVILIYIKLVSQLSSQRIRYKLACLRDLESKLMSLKKWTWLTIVTVSLYLQILLSKIQTWRISGMLLHIVSCQTAQLLYHQSKQKTTQFLQHSSILRKLFHFGLMETT